MGYTNSSMVAYTKITPNTYGKRTHKIDTITIHVVVGQVSLVNGTNIFSSPGYQWSCNYLMAKDGQVGLVLPEEYASICSSNKPNDERAITIETASDTVAPYKVTDAAFNGLVLLCADICKRNGIQKLVWSTNKSDRVNHRNGCNLTVHRDYAAKSCCGDYLYNLMGEIANRVNKILAGGSVTPINTKPATPAATTKPTSVPATKPASSTTAKVPTVVPAGVVLDWKNVTYNGISLKAVYNGKYYYEHNLDLKARVDKLYKTDEEKAAALFKHFCENGINEPRQAIATFNPVIYRNKYPDLAAVYGDKWAKYYSHYINFGIAEKRVAC